MWMLALMVTAFGTLYLPDAIAQNPPLKISDEGSLQGLPVFELDCSGTGISCSHSGITGTIAVDKADFSNDGDTAGANRTLGNNDNFDLGLETGGVTRLHVEGDGVGASAGNVGIGTTTPATPLDVIGDLQFSGNLRVDQTSMNFVVNGVEQFDIRSNARMYTMHNHYIGSKTSALEFSAATDKDLIFQHSSGATKFMVMKGASGYVGIGTVTPIRNLEVAGSGAVNGNLVVGVDNARNTPTSQTELLQLFNGNLKVSRNSATTGYAFFIGSKPSGPRISLGTNQEDDKFFIIGAYGSVINIDVYRDLLFRFSGVEKIRFTSDGKVGIGTSSPSESLDVNGGILSQAVTIDNGASSCLMIRDTDDAGWTECFTLDGVMSCSLDADGVCDGA